MPRPDRLPVLLLVMLCAASCWAQDTLKKADTGLPFPLKDRQGDFLTDDQQSPFLLNDPSLIKKEVTYDPETDRYIITETIDGRNVRPPTYMTFKEYLAYEREQSKRQYWKERAQSITLIEQKGVIPRLYVTKKKFGEIFGSNVIDIRPSGNIDLTLGGYSQTIDNPSLTEAARTNGGFDFDMKINMNVIGKIGDKVKINLSYNTEANFDFENQIKLQYEGEEDEIIKLIEGGNVSFPLPTTLISGSQSLFGVKTKLQFGRLTMTNVYSQQKSQAESITISQGAQTSEFAIYADQYDENRHFFLAQYFRDNYNKALSTLPNISSLVNITRLEVWVTNRTGATENARDVAAFMDLGETDKIYNTAVIQPYPGKTAPDNNANTLYNRLIADPRTRSDDQVDAALQAMGLVSVQDFEVTYMRKLSPSEYTYNAQLGFLSLNQALYADEVLAVAFEYTLNGETFQVGEFAQDVQQEIDTSANAIATQRIVFLKMLKGTSARPKLPVWDLMMKNIYPLGAFQINTEDFKLNVMYEDPGGGVKRYLPEGNLSGIPLIRVLSLDRLNSQLDPQPDGVFDFVPGITIIPSNGRIIFPVLEPFGQDLEDRFKAAGDPPSLYERYVYHQLYDSTKVIAQQFPNFNRFVLKGTYKSSVTNEISLGAFNIPAGSVTVTAGGQKLVEGRDFTVDYNLGRVKILNEGILNAGVPINVSYENNALFGFQTKTLFGMRLDYKISDKLSLGGTMMHLKEKPFTEKVNIGEDPIKNFIWGLDVNYNTESQFLTWLVDKLPLYETKEPSSFTFSAEMANLRPGHQKAIGKSGTVYIDDFEGTRSSYDLKFPATSWVLASTPRNAFNSRGILMFPEADLINDPAYGYNRARVAWYNIDPLFVREDSPNAPGYLTKDDKSNPYVREVQQKEVFPNRTEDISGFTTNILTFDLAYYPNQRGPYNLEVDPARVNPDGTLRFPESRWGGIMRSIDNSDFEATNTEYIEFWVLDPFIFNDNNPGDLYINLGYVSEDILRDNQKFYENGLQEPSASIPYDTTVWGKIPRNQPITNAFDNDQNKRQYQDVGLDGLNDQEEQIHFDSIYLQKLSFLNAVAYQNAVNDPASDNYRHFRDDYYDNIKAPILERYKYYNNPQGNSPLQQSGASYSNAATNIPDSEDLNRDFTLNKTEEYFQYHIRLDPQRMNVGENFIADKVTSTVTPVNGVPQTVTWYQFKVPIEEYQRKVGNISDFKSIRFIRMYLTGFQDSIILRFATLDLVRNQWRRYLFDLSAPDLVSPNDELNKTTFNVSAVNVEENSEKSPIPYALPPGIEREQNISSTNISALQNEQALQVIVCDLQDGDSRAVYKTLNLDLRTYERLKLYVHGESYDLRNRLRDGDVTVFLRLGSDFKNNYYEYELPLKITPDGIAYDPLSDNDRKAIWPVENTIDIPLDSFYLMKLARDAAQPGDYITPFSVVDARGNRYTIVGNPDLGVVRTAMLGIRNPKAEVLGGPDDGRPKCVEVWFNEFRLTGLDEKGGWAATTRLETRLADLGGLTFSTLMHTRGYGQIDQKVQERYKDDFWQYDLAGNIDLGKFFPKKIGLRIPMYGGISQSFSTPEFDPYQLDVPLEEKIRQMQEEGISTTSYKRQVQTLQTIRSINFTNVRVVPERQDKKIRFYHPANLNFTFAYTSTEKSDPFIESDLVKRYKASLGYNFSPQPKYFSPLSKAIKSKSKYLDIFRNVNINFIPSSLSFSTDFNRQFGKTQLRTLPGDDVYTGEIFLTTFTGGFGGQGVMFELRPNEQVTITSFDVNLNPSSGTDIAIYYRSGPYSGVETNPSQWTLLGTATGITPNPTGTATPVPIPINVTIPPGQRYAFYITTTNGTNLAFSAGTSEGALFKSDGILAFYEGIELAGTFVNPSGPRVFNGRIHYMTDQATYEKSFTWDRIYGLKYNPTRSLSLDFTAINNAAIDEPPGDLGPFGSAGKDSLWSNILSWGRTTRYQHNLSVNYNIPINQIPLTDWITARAAYSSSYTWITGPLYRNPETDQVGPNPLGNTITNTQDIRLNGELNFKNLYDKFKRLKPYNTSRSRMPQDWKMETVQKKKSEIKKREEKIDKDISQLKKDIEKINENIKQIKQDTVSNKREQIRKLKTDRKNKKKQIRKLKSDRYKLQVPENPIVSPFVRPFIALKRVSASYSINSGTTIPGYTPRTQILGLSDGFGSPGWGFIFGYQPDRQWLDEAARKGWITRDTNLNYQVLQSKVRNLNIKAVVEPFRDLRVDLTLDRSIAHNYSEYFKVKTLSDPENPNPFHEHLSPLTTGNYSVSYVAIKTLFQKSDARGFTAAFRALQDVNRVEVSKRLGEGNRAHSPIGQPALLLFENDTLPDAAYSYGYGRYSQEVLIPAFVAAYSGKDPKAINLDPFSVFPLPNWRITYNGLTNLPGVNKIIKSFTLSHGYSSTYTINSFTTNLDFEGDGYFHPSKIDTPRSFNFIPQYSIQQVVITEQLSPLLGIDITWEKNVTSKFEYRKSRNVSLGLVDYQVSESKTTEITVGLGYKLKGLTLPFKWRGQKRKLPNDINFKVDFSLRDNITFNQRLDQEISEPTRGTKTYKFLPEISYEINKRLNVRLFYEYNRSIPATSASYPITSHRGGVTIRFSLTP
ncbi:MAG: hypothetical protein KatS3mg031_2433 [Chitinophagales bacterium]|nr:MAG: hypothetical protein KatS3mg031_2433 [Chitinophagales bacterium]